MHSLLATCGLKARSHLSCAFPPPDAWISLVLSCHFWAVVKSITGKFHVFAIWQNIRW